MFYPLYPIGISAEWWLLYRAIGPAGEISWVIPPIFWGCLMLYVPGTYLRSVVYVWEVLIETNRLVEDVYIHDQAAKEDSGWTAKGYLISIEGSGNGDE
jgi:hypothetical protein